MTRAVLRRLALAATVAFATAACSHSSSNEPPAPRQDRDVLTQQQMQEHRFQSVWDAVESMRANWLQVRGTDTFVGTPTEIWVYMDNNKVGGIDTLKGIMVSSVVYIRHYDGVSAQARWGIGHSQGVIFVSTH